MTKTSSVGAETAAQLRIRFQRIEMLLTGLPGASAPDQTQAALLGVDPDERSLFLAMAAESVRDASAELKLRRPHEIDDIRRDLAGRRLLLYGDSITADRESWAEILRAILHPAVDVVVSGRSGDTTTDLLARFATSVRDLRPDLVVVLAGTNDARRNAASTLGGNFGPTMVSASESAKNYAELDRLITAVSGNRAVWLEPPPIIEHLLQDDPSAAEAGVGWTASDVRERGTILERAFPPRYVPLAKNFGSATRLQQLMLPDGLHPSLEGHVVIAEAALTGLSAMQRSGELLRAPITTSESAAR